MISSQSQRSLLKVLTALVLPIVATAKINGFELLSDHDRDLLSSSVVPEFPGVMMTSATNANQLRKLAVSQTCIDESLDILDDMSAEIPTIDNLDDDELNDVCKVNNAQTKLTCDFDKFSDVVKASCELEGGRFLSVDYEIKCSDVAYKIKNSPDCVAPSCDVDEVIEEVEDNLNDVVRSDCTVTVSGVASSLGSTFVSFGLMIVTAFIPLLLTQN